MGTYKPKDFGALIGRTTSTLQRWDREGRLKAHRTPTNRRYYTHDQYLEYIGQKADKDQRRMVYYRVSSSGQKDDLESQREALEQFCIAAGKPVDQWLKDIGSPLIKSVLMGSSPENGSSRINSSGLLTEVTAN